MDKKGICYLAGAGPGDPGLVTLKTRECLEKAEVAVYDYLCNPALLSWVPAGAEIIYAGKKAGNHALPQEEINRLLVEKTLEGKKVVRLKGGDPFLFGRGGEEAEALAEKGLAFEIIPGVTSAIAGPAYAGIPVTHRDFASQLTIFTGHEDPEKNESSLDYAQLAKAPGTKIMLMGVENLGRIRERFFSEGVSPSLPVALVRWATTGRQETLVGELGNIVEKVKETKFAPPAVAVFGEVVKLRDKLNWFEKKPLFGKKVVVTRTRKQASTLTDVLRNAGAEVLEIPTIRIEPPVNKLEFAQLVQDAHTYDWIVFTSPNGVSAFFDAFFKLYDDAREIGGARIAAIGPATAEQVRKYHLKVDLQPKEFVAEGILKSFQEEGSVENLRILLARAEGARPVLAQRLMEMGAIVDEAVAYRTVPEDRELDLVKERFEKEGADLITFTSSSTVKNFLALKLAMPSGIKIASIGPITSQTIRENGLSVDIEAKQYDIPGLTEVIYNYYYKSRK